MHDRRFGEGQRFPHEASEPLSQGVVEPLDMIGLSTAFPGPRMLIGRQDRGISFPEVMKTMGGTVGGGDRIPKALAGLETAVTDGKGDHLPRAATERQPEPGLIQLTDDKRPEFIEFQHISRFGRNQGRFQGWFLIDFFLSRR
jgi:hypothetical protein